MYSLVLSAVIQATLVVIATGKAHVFPLGVSITTTGSDSKDILLAVEDAQERSDRDYISARDTRFMDPFRWYPFIPKKRFRAEIFRPSQRDPRPCVIACFGRDGRLTSGTKPSTSYRPLQDRYNHIGSAIRHGEDRYSPYRPSSVSGFLPRRKPSRNEKPSILVITAAEGPEFGSPNPATKKLGPPMDLFVCPDHHSCTEGIWESKDTRDSLSWRDRGCMCDDSCHQYNDCCRDAKLAKNVSSRNNDADDNQEKIAAEEALSAQKLEFEEETSGSIRNGKHFWDFGSSPSGDDFVCMKIPALDTHNRNPSTDQYYIRAGCPPEFDGFDNKIRCEHPARGEDDPLSVIPVTSGVTLITYANYYCAMCHNDTFDLKFWQIGIVCRRFSDKSEEMTRQDVADFLTRSPRGGWGLKLKNGDISPCAVTSRPPSEISPRQCISTISTCPPGSPSSLIEPCRNHTAVVYSRGRAYRNVYCLLCHSDSLSVECSAPCPEAESPAGAGGLRTRLQLRLGEDARCGEKQIRDPFTKKCRSVVCSKPGYLLDGMECVKEDGRDDVREQDDRAGNKVNSTDEKRITENPDDQDEFTTNFGPPERYLPTVQTPSNPEGSIEMGLTPPPPKTGRMEDNSDSGLEFEIDYEDFSFGDISSELEAAFKNEISKIDKQPTNNKTTTTKTTTITTALTTARTKDRKDSTATKALNATANKPLDENTEDPLVQDEAIVVEETASERTMETELTEGSGKPDT